MFDRQLQRSDRRSVAAVAVAATSLALARGARSAQPPAARRAARRTGLAAATR